MDLEAAADHMMHVAQQVKKIAHDERLKLTGSSLPVVRKGLNEKQIAADLSGRLKTINKKALMPASNNA